MKQFKDLNIKPKKNGLIGSKIKIDYLVNRKIIIHMYDIVDSKFTKKNSKIGTEHGKCLQLQIEVDNIKHVVFTTSKALLIDIAQIDKNVLPIETTIIKEGKAYLFS